MIMKKAVFFILSTFCFSLGLICSSCSGGKSEQQKKEQDSLEQVQKKAYKDLLFGMPISKVKELGYLGEGPIQNISLEDIDDDGTIHSKEEVNGITSYCCNYKSIGNYEFDFATLGFAKDSLVQVQFQKDIDFKSSLNGTYEELKTILDSNLGSPVYENTPNFTNPVDCDVLKYKIGTKEVELSLSVDEDAVVMGFNKCYSYLISIIDAPHFNKASSESNITSDI